MMKRRRGKFGKWLRGFIKFKILELIAMNLNNIIVHKLNKQAQGNERLELRENCLPIGERETEFITNLKQAYYRKSNPNYGVFNTNTGAYYWRDHSQWQTETIIVNSHWEFLVFPKCFGKSQLRRPIKEDLHNRKVSDSFSFKLIAQRKLFAQKPWNTHPFWHCKWHCKTTNWHCKWHCIFID